MTNIVLAALSTGIEGGFSVIYDIPQDLWDNISRIFDKNNVNKLLWHISGDSTATVDNMAPIEDLAATKLTSADMIANYNKVNPASADNNYSVSAMSNDAEIIVTLGGLKWTPVYLSTTNEGKEGETHDVILTLWLTDASQLSGGTYADGKTFDKNGLALWASGWYNNSPLVDYPCNMYGTSYMRAAVLNNGGQYAHNNANDDENIYLETATQNPDSIFALFTMQDGGLRDFIVTPSQVSWQECGQSAKAEIDSLDYNVSNENWGDKTKVPNDGFYYGSSFNYANKGEANSRWKDDWLWLPSLSETGGDDASNGIWQTSQNQRRNTDFNDWTHHAWLRSAYYTSANSVYLLCGTEYGFDATTAYRTYGTVRPALHLNLTEVAKSLNK